MTASRELARGHARSAMCNEFCEKRYSENLDEFRRQYRSRLTTRIISRAAVVWKEDGAPAAAHRWRGHARVSIFRWKRVARVGYWRWHRVVDVARHSARFLVPARQNICDQPCAWPMTVANAQAQSETVASAWRIRTMGPNSRYVSIRTAMGIGT